MDYGARGELHFIREDHILFDAVYWFQSYRIPRHPKDKKRPSPPKIIIPQKHLDKICGYGNPSEWVLKGGIVTRQTIVTTDTIIFTIERQSPWKGWIGAK